MGPLRIQKAHCGKQCKSGVVAGLGIVINESSFERLERYMERFCAGRFELVEIANPRWSVRGISLVSITPRFETPKCSHAVLRLQVFT